MTQTFTREQAISVPVTVPNGGTGVTSVTGVLTGNGASPITGSAVTEGAVLLAGASNVVTDTGVLAKGDLIVGDGVTAPVLLNVGSDNEVLTADSSEPSGLKWAAPAGGAGSPFTGLQPNATGYVDFCTNTGATAGWGFINTLVGDATYNEVGHPGVTTLTTNSASTGTTLFYISGGTMTAEGMIKWAAVSAASDLVIFGFADSISSSPTNGCYFRYNGSTDFWECVTESSSVETATTTSITDTAVWRRLTIVVNAAGTSVEFFIDGSSVAVHTTNIPSTSTSMLVNLKGINLSTGDVRVDYLMYNFESTRPA